MQGIDRLEIDSGGSGENYARGYELYISDDGKTWGGPIKTGQGSAVTIIAFDKVMTRHFKVVQTGRLSSEDQNTHCPWKFREITAFLEP